ncbi:unnamed protein product, partial [Oikopleura dioica]
APDLRVFLGIFCSEKADFR